MTSLKEIVEEIPIEDLQDKELCIRCISAGMSIDNALYYPEEMQEGISTSDMICNHCHDTEDELGYKRMTKKEMENVGKIMDEFKKYKEQRLNITHN